MTELKQAEELASRASTRFYEVDSKVIADKREKKNTEGLLEDWNVKRREWRHAECVLEKLR
ncbi:hypothetical protein [Solimicrobium silvestre]|uniref:Uncharacterized protein n=1 Tax=Solimicrobium silvestre TaxID=2099400 RepID=A0A2S9GY45_9BURK|nr:hypothetical protein [Solimicrobium silvestre]PRC92645.1 hypothetical protein S2091_2700 [Solimicrobium silvestre]